MPEPKPVAESGNGITVIEQEAREELNQTALWNNAGAISLIYDRMLDSDCPTRDGLEALLSESKISVDEQILDGVFEIIEEKRSQVDSELESLALKVGCTSAVLRADLQNCGEYSKAAAIIFFEELTGEKPKASFSLGTDGVSFMINGFENGEDFITLHQAHRSFAVGGYAEGFQIFNIKSNNDNEFALIAFDKIDNPDELTEARRHEQAHFLETMLVKALHNKGYDPYELADSEEIRAARSEFDKFLKEYAETYRVDRIQVTESELDSFGERLCETMLPNMYAFARSEVLADFIANGNVDQYKAILFTYHGYDFIGSIFPDVHGDDYMSLEFRRVLEYV